MEHPKTPATMPFLANILCASANKVEKSSTKVTDRSNVNNSFPMTIAAAVPLAFGVAMVTYWTIFLPHSRRELNSLEDESSGVWLDGSTMMHCADEKFHTSIIETALSRGYTTLKNTHISQISTHAKAQKKITDFFYQSSSSNGNPSENEESPSQESNILNGKNTLIKPKLMTKQVGGLASHKRPVLTLEPHFILKPLKLHTFDAKSSGIVLAPSSERLRNTTIQDIPSVAVKKPNEEDMTKIYRGLREIAFYEALQFASLLPSLNPSSPEGMSAKEFGILQKCRHPCVGYHPDSGSNTTNSTHAQDSIKTKWAKSWQNLANEMESLKELAKFISPYHGFIDLNYFDEENANSPPSFNSSNNNQPQYPKIVSPYLLLRNLIKPYTHPNVIDIKMGTQTYEPSAPKSKRIRESDKYPSQSEIGFRIVGMRVYDPSCGSEDGYRYWNKSFGVSLTKREEVLDALMVFFNCKRNGGDVSYAKLILVEMVSELKKIKAWFEMNTTLAFYASSILMVYEGSNEALSSELKKGECEDPILKMIDFAHVCRQEGGDGGYLKGISNLLAMLEEVLEKLRV
mmetsp:Transcript_11508/g.24366  ORF Transcript_11508/g.24366 Transcript_11508/m.24366 type:complete len:572 (+) Transcript_11508:61-1776(+)